jgi:uncharacterized LabA/DUF88 family protein
MRVRRIAILIDGAFFLKRLPKIKPELNSTPSRVAEAARLLCKNHVQNLIREPRNTKSSRWLDHVYRLFYYDAHPFDQIAHNPISNQQIQFGKTPEAKFRNDLFSELRKKRKFALRLGKVNKEDGWHLKNADITKKVLKVRDWIPWMEAFIEKSERNESIPPLSEPEIAVFRKQVEFFRNLDPGDVRLSLKQKGVDMRIGVDITSIALKKQADTMILVTGDSDFVPAAKVARREGVEFLIDPLWQSINDDLHEHVDGVVSAFSNPEPSSPSKHHKNSRQKPVDESEINDD